MVMFESVPESRESGSFRYLLVKRHFRFKINPSSMIEA